MRLNFLKLAVSQYLAKYPGEVRRLAHLLQQIDIDGENLFNRSNMNGHITASSLVLNTKGTKALLIYHPYLKIWVQPGGHVDPEGYSVEETARQEVLEETGLIVLPPKSIFSNFEESTLIDIDTHFIPKNDLKNEHFHYHHDFVFISQALSDDAVQDHELCDNNKKWVDLSELAEKAGSKERMPRIVGKLKALGIF